MAPEAGDFVLNPGLPALPKFYETLVDGWWTRAYGAKSRAARPPLRAGVPFRIQEDLCS